MKGYAVPFIDSVRRDLRNPEERRIYLQGAIEALLAEDPLDCAITLHLFFDATWGYDAAGAVVGMSAESLEIALRDSTTLTLQQFGQLIQFAMRQDKLRVAATLLLAEETGGTAIQRQAA